MIAIRPARQPINATVRVPGSKSYTNRALAIAALTPGVSRLTGALFSDDTHYMATGLNALGIPVDSDPLRELVIVQGQGGLIPNDAALVAVGNAGTAARFLMAIAALGRGRYVLDGSDRMHDRPQAPLVEALGQLGAEIRSNGKPGCLPLSITAKGLAGGSVHMAGSQSSQFFSALLMVAPAMRAGLELTVDGELISRPYVDITLDIMSSFGVRATRNGYRRFVIPSHAHYLSREYAVEPDASAASYFFAAAALTGGTVTVSGLHRTSRQGDVTFVDVLAQMGCQVVDEPDGLTVTGPSQLHGVSVDMNAISDTAITLAAMAPFADSPVEVTHIEHVRAQECDRISAVVAALRALGVAVDERADGFLIHPSTPHGGRVVTQDDHRMAMGFALVGLRTQGVIIDRPECVSKTFPRFFEQFLALTGPEIA